MARPARSHAQEGRSLLRHRRCRSNALQARAFGVLVFVTVIGLFEEWKGSTGEVDLGREATLVMFTDGVVEAFDAQGGEFGDERLVDLVLKQTRLPAATLVQALVDAVHRYSGPTRSDDLTLVVAKRRHLNAIP